jgi:hypothetical protein
MRIAIPALLTLVFLVSRAVAQTPFPQFKVQEIDKTLKVGYGLKIVDLNGDGKLDIVVADAARVIWFDQAGGWKLRTIIDNAKAGVKPDNVCLDVFDIDADGKLDVALGADWQPNNTKSGGSLQWLRQGKSIDEPWTVHRIAESIPTLHRIHIADADHDGKPELLVGPLKGTGSTAEKHSMDKPVRLLAYAIHTDATGDWDPPSVVDESMHVMHNFAVVHVAGKPMTWTASYEGVGVLTAGKGGKWAWTRVGAGNQDNPNASRGSSEVKAGFDGKQPAYLAAIEPFHGHQVVTYRFGQRSSDDAPPEPTATRTVVDEQLKAGHALWCADLDGDGLDEIIAGFREPTDKGTGPGINIYKASGTDEPMVWARHVLDDKGIACEDLACADLDGDGKIDVVACGRSTGNVRIYWNKGASKP